MFPIVFGYFRLFRGEPEVCDAAGYGESTGW